MSSYCYDCECESVLVSKKKQKKIDGWLYAHDECPECGKIFYSPAVPKWEVKE